ncbi:TIGR02285 family protein [Thalassospira australica]|uniref:TIGR02285 family protein n=1 Tax=Thalassospira australica TaxID=1528106 RepID=UPI0009DFF06E|nr:TIGR02285 family protein [Thalassospira australica]
MAWHLRAVAKSWIAGAIFALTFLASLETKAQTSGDNTTIIWAIPPLAPAFIWHDNTLKGYAADTQEWFTSRLPDYAHSVLEVPLARLLAEMKNGAEGELRCSTTLIPTAERRDYIVFAKTVLLHLPNAVVIRAGEEGRFDPFLTVEGHVDLDRLLATGDLQSAVRIGRAYGTRIDTALARHQNAAQVMTVADDTKFLRMLELNRIDWTLYFPSEAEYYRREQTPNLEINALPVAGNTTLLEATIGCANTPAGQKAIAEINAIIDQNPTMPWTDFYARWLGPNDRDWFFAARDQYINSDHFETRLEYNPATTGTSQKQ